MAYLGNVKPTETTSSVLRSTYTGDGSTTTYNLPGPVANETSIIATINGVTQQDTAYSTNGSQIIFSGAPALGDAIELRTISGVGLSYAPSAGSVTTGILADGAVTSGKIANAAVSDALIAGVSASKVSGALASGNMPSGSVLRVYSATAAQGVIVTGTYFNLGLTWTDVVVNAGETPYLNLHSTLKLVSGAECHAAMQLRYTGSASGTIGDASWGLGITLQPYNWGLYSISNLNMRTVRGGSTRNFGTNTGTFTFTTWGSSTNSVGFGTEQTTLDIPYAHLQGSIVIVKD